MAGDDGVGGDGGTATVVVQSPNDKKLYRVIRLENGLRALLISDPEAAAAAAELEAETEGHDVPTEGSRAMDTLSNSGESEGELSEGRGGTSMSEGEGESEGEEEGESAGYSKGNRNAAAALSVGVGSFWETPDLGGLGEPPALSFS